MKFSTSVGAVALALAAGGAFAQTSTFVSNGGVHEAAEYGSNTFQIPMTSVLDKYTFSLGTAVTAIDSDVAFVGRPPLTGTITLWRDLAVDTVVDSYTFAQGSKSFGALAAGAYYYMVAATGSGGGGYTFGSYITPVPEPGTVAMLLAGLGVVSLLARRRTS